MLKANTMHRNFSRSTRQAIIAQVEASNAYDAATVKIHRDGMVSAKRDPNKAPGCLPGRFYVGHADDLLMGA